MKDFKELYRDFQKISKEYSDLQKNLPRIAGDAAVKVIRHNFEVEGFCEDSEQPQQKWSDRDEKTDYGYDNYKTYSGRNYSSSNPILKQTGNLRDSVGFKVEGENTVFIGSNLTLVPYAKAVNERVRNGVPDKFLGWSKFMAETIKNVIQRQRKNIFRKWLISSTGEGKGLNLSGTDFSG